MIGVRTTVEESMTKKNVPDVVPATLTDLEDIASFNACIHEDELVKPTIRDLIIMKKIPEIERGFLLARNPENGEIISSCCLIPQTLRYGNIPIQAGNPEFVGTDVAFRRMGLISKQFEIMHQWSEENGDDLLLIGGVPYFYRQYGYEMTVNMGNHRTAHPSVLDEVKQPENEIRFELAAEKDIPELIRLLGQDSQAYLISGDWSRQDWLYMLADQKNNGCAAQQVYMIRRKNGVCIGTVRYNNRIDEGHLYLVGANIDPVLSTWDEVESALLIQLKSVAEESVKKSGKILKEVGIQLPPSHPLYIRTAHIFPNENHGYAWYVSIPNLLQFLNKVKPVLEENIHNSPYRGLSRMLYVNLFTRGLQIEFTKGKIKSIKEWKAKTHEDGDFLCPELAFYHLVMGHRTTTEIQHLYRDCYGKKDGAQIIDFCFPKRDSYLYLAI
jgi:hypothetical protein